MRHPRLERCRSKHEALGSLTMVCACATRIAPAGAAAAAWTVGSGRRTGAKAADTASHPDAPFSKAPCYSHTSALTVTFFRKKKTALCVSMCWRSRRRWRPSSCAAPRRSRRPVRRPGARPIAPPFSPSCKPSILWRRGTCYQKHSLQ